MKKAPNWKACTISNGTSQATATVASLQPPFDSLNVLVASQGIVEYKRAEFQMPTFRKVLDVNLMSVMSSCTKFHAMLAKTQGSIIVLGSGASFFSVLGNPAYSASKGALVTLTKTLAEAWAGDGIRVNGIAPGLIATKITKSPGTIRAAIRIHSKPFP